MRVKVVADISDEADRPGGIATGWYVRRDGDAAGQANEGNGGAQLDGLEHRRPQPTAVLATRARLVRVGNGSFPDTLRTPSVALRKHAGLQAADPM